MPTSTRLFILIASLLGATGVACGAYASHGLSNWASPQQIELFSTAVTYQLFHAITLFAVCILSLFYRSRILLISQCFFALGVVFFSGSLYWYVLSGVKLLGAITPIGGLLLILAWLLLGLSVFIKK